MPTFYYFDWVSGRRGKKSLEKRRRERSDGTLGTFLPLFFYLNPSSFLHPSLRSQVLEVWSIDYMDPASWPRAVCTLCCPDNPLTLTIFVQHRHFFSSIIFSFLFLRPVINTCASYNVFSDNTYLLPSLLSMREYIYIYPFTFIATSESINNVISKFYIISNNLITMKIFRYAEKFIFRRVKFSRVSWNQIFTIFSFSCFPLQTR